MATSIATKTLQETKISALKNAVINSTKPTTLEFSQQQIFLYYIDTFSVAHFKLLHFLTDPRNWFIKNGQELPKSKMESIELTIRDIIIKAYPELENERELINSIWMDLYSKDLLEGDKRMLDARSTLPRYRTAIDTLLPKMNVLSCHTTALGKQFVTFISE